MKFTQVLHRQHIGRAIRRMWGIGREKTIPVSPSLAILNSMGYQVEDANKVVQESIRKKFFRQVELPVLEPFFEVEVPEPKEVLVHMYEAKYMLQAGLNQARLLTNTVIKDEKLPDRYIMEDIPEDLDVHVQRIITNCTIFDAHQELLPKIKDPERPMFVFPRLYGITQYRKTHDIASKLLQICETLDGGDVSNDRFVDFKNDISFRTERFGNTIQCDVSVDLLLRSTKPLDPVEPAGQKSDYTMPNIYPLEPLISMPSIEKARDYKRTTWSNTRWNNMHTAFVYHNPEMIQNLTLLPVTDDQILGRTLMHVFTVAANCAQNTHGNTIERLPEPVTVQCVQTDGQDFIFSVFQLNGMHDDLVNYWWKGPTLRLYEKAEFENGRPVFKGYNKDVFKTLLAFYRQQ